MPERSDHPHPDPEREREESTDLGYRDTEEERAYEEAAEGRAPGSDPAAEDEEEGPVGGG